MKLLNDMQRTKAKKSTRQESPSADSSRRGFRSTESASPDLSRSGSRYNESSRVTQLRPDSPNSGVESRSFNTDRNKKLRKSQFFCGLFGMAVGVVFFGSVILAIPLGLLGSLIPIYRSQKRAERRQRELARIWPELLDHMISGLRSGLSIAETISSLSKRGPEISRPIFQRCQADMVAGSDLQNILHFIKSEFNDPIADQVCEVLDFARGTGSRDTAVTLRTLGDFIRSDIAVRGEIHAKLGWVRNSAVIAAAAPWILLGILASQPTTIVAYKTGTGIVILGGGILMSLLAYLWMAKVGKIHITPRIFAAAGRA